MVDKNFIGLDKPDITRFESYLPTAFSSELTLLQKVNKIIQDLNRSFDLSNDVVDYLNRFIAGFDEKLYGTLDDVLNVWLEDGKLTKFVRETINEEVVLARDGAQTLRERLDSDKAESLAKANDIESDIDVLSINKMDKNTTNISVSQINKNLGKIDQTYLTDELLQQMTGETPINAVPAERSIIKNQLAFPVLETTSSINKFNKLTITLSRYVGSDGQLVINPKYNTSDFIPVLPDVSYMLNEIIFNYAWYDENKVFVSYFGYTGNQLIPPVNARYIRFAFTANLENTLQFEQGEKNSPYQDYFVLPESSIQSVSLEKLNFLIPSKNEFDKSLVTKNRYITDEGVLVSGVGYNVTNFIPVKVIPYALNKLGFGNIICFDVNKNFIGFVRVSINSFVPLPLTSFIRFTVTDALIDTTQLEKGLFPTSYESYGYKIPVSVVSGMSNDDISKNKRITVGKSNSNFTTINDALNSITDASEDNQYEIFIRKGVYNETFRTKHWIDIIGEDKYQTIVNYTGTLQSWNNTSTVFAETNGKLMNMTLIGTDTKYPLHIDKSTGRWNLIIENVRCIHKGSLTDSSYSGTPVGVGLYEYQNLTLKNCEMIDESGATGSSGVFFHNNLDSLGSGYRSIRIEECLIKGVTYGIRPNDVEGNSLLQNNDAYIINNDITSKQQEYYYPENSPSWHIFKKGNSYTNG